MKKEEVERKSWDAVEKLTRFSNFTEFVHSFIGSFIFCSFIHASDINNCLLCPRYSGRHFGQSNSRAVVSYYREVGGAEKNSQMSKSVDKRMVFLLSKMVGLGGKP